MKRIVDGILIDMTSEEISAREAEILEYENNTIIPQSVTMVQARKALVQGGTSIASVDAAIAAIVDPSERQMAQIDWEYSTTVRRDSPLVASLAPALQLSETQVDDLFILAQTL